MSDVPAEKKGPGRPRRSVAGRMVDVVVGPFVQPVVDAVDVGDVVDRIDVDELIARIDVDELIGRIDVDELIGRIDVDALMSRIDVDGLVGRIDVEALLARIHVDDLIGRIDVDALVARIDLDGALDRVDPDRLLDRIDPDRLLDRVDPDRLLDRIDPDRLLDRVDPDRLLDRLDPDRLLDRVDPDRLLDRVDPDRLLGRVDADQLLDRVDPDRLLDRVDPDRLLDRVDPDRLLARVDFDAVVERVDVNAVMDRVDVNSLVSRTELGEVIARSTTGVFGQLLDAGRIAVMALDLTLHGLAARVLRRKDPTAQFGPEHLHDQAQMWRLPPQDRAVALQGRYAGAVSRFLAFLADVTLTGALFGLIGALVVAALQIVANVTWDAADHRLLVGLAYVSWQFTYFAGLTAITGRTIGKAVLGVSVVRPDGTRVAARGAALRTIAFPLSFVLFGAGFFLGVVRRDRRQLHDLIGGTAVVYAWDAETARLRSAPLQSSPTPDSAVIQPG
jgi:uncharacterized RDD family membrane protein YckC